jgi:tetratricopeptide (TPR) repeat protein
MLAPPAWADPPALAQPTEPAARLHFTQGNRLYRIRRFEEAVAAYQAGAVIEPVPVFDYNLGQCYRKLGRHADALWHYERFLRNGRPEGELHALVTDFLRQLRAELDRKPVLQPPAEVAPKPDAPVGRSGPSPMPAADLSVSVVARGERWYSDRLGWSLVAGGVAAAGGTAYLLARAAGLQYDAATTPDENRRIDLRGAAHARRVIGTAFGVGSAALIAAGAIKLAIHSRERPRAKAASWGIGISGRGVAVLGRF